MYIPTKDPYNRASGPKYYNINGIWVYPLYYLDPWTLGALRVCFHLQPQLSTDDTCAVYIDFTFFIMGVPHKQGYHFGYIGFYRVAYGHIGFRV